MRKEEESEGDKGKGGIKEEGRGRINRGLRERRKGSVNKSKGDR